MTSLASLRSATLAAALAAPALAHNHITVDTVGGAAGDRILIKAGYYSDESGFTIDAGGRLRANGDFAVYEVPDQLADGGALSAWYAGDEFVLTSDFYYGTGRLNGGDFRFEITQVRPVCDGDAALAWGDFTDDGFEPSAASGAATRAARSYGVGAGGHNHDQGYAFSEPGVYDVQLVAWDANGRYRDSDPITIRFHVGRGPLPDASDFDCSGSTDSGDLGLLLLNFGPADPGSPYDLDGSGEVDSGDLGLLLLSFS
jgi:hypothetical protein